MKISHIYLFFALALSAIGCNRSAPAEAPAKAVTETPTVAPAPASADTTATEEKAEVKETTTKPWEEEDVLGTALENLEGKVNLSAEQRQQLETIAAQYSFQGASEAEKQRMWKKLREQVVREVLTPAQRRQMRGA